MKIKDRLQRPTPRFFRKLRNIGIALSATGAAILAAPIALPVIIITIASYVTVAGAVATTVSQAVIADKE